MAFLESLAVDWRVSDATATRDAPYQRFVNYQFEDSAGSYRYEGDINDNYTRFSEIEDNTSDYGIDFELPVVLIRRRRNGSSVPPGHGCFDQCPNKIHMQVGTVIDAFRALDFVRGGN